MKDVMFIQERLFDDMVFEVAGSNPNDVVYTPEEIAKTIIAHFQPTGICLDPCRGDGAFHRHLPGGAHYCEITEGKDFFDWHQRVDWIISNPPFSVYREWLLHSFEIADNIVYLVPIIKVFTTSALLGATTKFGGIVEILHLGSGREVGFDMGFAVGAVHYKRGYVGPIMFRHHIDVLRRLESTI